jgi:hypothetical protein
MTVHLVATWPRASIGTFIERDNAPRPNPHPPSTNRARLVEQDPLIGVAAHELLNSATAVRGLIATARSALAGHDDAAEAVELMLAAERKTAAMAERLRFLALGLVLLGPDDAPAPPTAQCSDLDGS